MKGTVTVSMMCSAHETEGSKIFNNNEEESEIVCCNKAKQQFLHFPSTVVIAFNLNRSVAYHLGYVWGVCCLIGEHYPTAAAGGMAIRRPVTESSTNWRGLKVEAF